MAAPYFKRTESITGMVKTKRRQTEKTASGTGVIGVIPPQTYIIGRIVG